MKLTKATRQELPGIRDLLLELGEGESGFGGTDFAHGQMALDVYLQLLEDMSEGRNLQSGWVRMTTFWLLDSQSEPVGMSRLRHELTESLLVRGGHIGYYICPFQRGRGYGKFLLAATLREARKLGIRKVLLTTDSDNIASIRVIEANGGKVENMRCDSDGKRYGRYWIELTEES